MASFRKKIQQRCTSLTFDNWQFSQRLGITFPKVESFECWRLVVHPLAEPQPAAGLVYLFVCLFLFSVLGFGFGFVFNRDWLLLSKSLLVSIFVHKYAKLASHFEHCLLPWLFFHCPVYSMGPDLSSSATRGAPLNLASLTCTKQGCRNDHCHHRLCLWPGDFSLGSSHCMDLLLGPGEEGACGLPDEGAWQWEEEELWRACRSIAVAVAGCQPCGQEGGQSPQCCLGRVQASNRYAVQG